MFEVTLIGINLAKRVFQLHSAPNAVRNVFTNTHTNFATNVIGLDTS